MQPTQNGHPPDVDLTDYAVGKLDPLRAAFVERHVETCEQCQAVIAAAPVDAFVEQLRRAGPALLPAEPNRGDGIPAGLVGHARFRVQRRLALGGMGTVYLAEHKILGVPVALKVARFDRGDPREAQARLIQEARTAAQLVHPAIARVLDAEQLDDMAMLAMEYVEGETLAALVTRKGPLGVEEACRCVRQIAGGLDHAHRRGVIHRDLKPQNLMVTPQGRVKILDFGLGRYMRERNQTPRLTRDRQMLGTPNYVAPEQARNARSADIRSDLYSLGCVFYYLLAGVPPFSGQHPLEIVTKHQEAPPPDIRALRHDAPAVIAELIGRLLAKDPAARLQSPRELADALDRYLGANPRSRKQDACPEPPRRVTSRTASALRATAAAFTRVGWRRLWTPAVVLPLLTSLICLLVVLLS
ncbi:MAG: protein kinase [Pirellulales bacterium]|nr:protein kinase [Pirellulales bacterium]